MNEDFERISENGIVYYRAKNISECGFLKHMFTTKLGGVSRGEISGLNLGINKEPCKENVVTNFKTVCGILGADIDETFVLKQIHTDNIHEYKKGDVSKIYNTEDRVRADSVVSNVKGSSFGVFYADCVPVILADKEKGTAAAIHSGWRSTAVHIAKKAAEKMIEKYGCNPRDIRAVIGPSIRQCCFEVDLPVALEFEEKYRIQKGEKYHIDLQQVISDDLISAGILRENISDCGICTCHRSDEFYSNRAHKGKIGLMAAVVKIER